MKLETIKFNCLLVAGLGALSGYAVGNTTTVIEVDKPVQFTTTIQFAVQENSPQLTHRSQNVVIDQFSKAFGAWPQLAERPYKVKTNGTEVVFFVSTPSDLRGPMQQMMADVIQHLNGRVRAKGRSQFFKTSLEQPMGGFLEVIMTDDQKMIISLDAQSVPLRDILKEIKLQVGELSYLVPGDCARQLVDWHFGDNDSQTEPKSVDSAMQEIGALFNLAVDKHQHTYIFRGSCQGMPMNRMAPLARPAADPMIQTKFWSNVHRAPMPPTQHRTFTNTQVFFPVAPLAIGQ